MAYYFKIGLLILNDDQTKFLVCEKDKNDVTDDYIMPGGQMNETTVEECLRNEIKEELDCAVDFKTLTFIDEFTDAAAGQPEREVAIELYRADIIGTPTPSSEVKFIHWVGKADRDNQRLSPIVRNKIIPALVERGLLK
jgi:ADP-ribose pyrophosphatase YjhB (NUDIX family)